MPVQLYDINSVFYIYTIVKLAAVANDATNSIASNLAKVDFLILA